MNQRTTIILAGLFGALAVAAGAFGAHGLRDQVDARDLEIWSTGAHYQLLHAAVLLALGLIGADDSPWRARASLLMLVGLVIFPGTLYAMVLGAPRWLGAVTPIGGMCWILGWLAVAVYGWGLETAAAPKRP